MRIVVPIGTRPEFVKMAPVLRALRDGDHTPLVIVTGQHHDQLMATQFLVDLDIDADEYWTLPSGEADKLGALMANAVSSIGRRDDPVDAVMALGDTWTVPFAAMAARRFGLPFIHVEAGLRSFNERSVEEGNRRIAGQLAALHLAPTEWNARFLRSEGVATERIRVVGNPVTDALREQAVPIVPVKQRRGALFTAHRATNVDDPHRLRRLVGILLDLADTVEQVHFPVHPRTRDRLETSGLESVLRDHARIEMTEPLGYEDLLATLAGSRLVVTDSGGLQEEAAWFGVPAVVMRRSTPRWEGVDLDVAAVVGLDPDQTRAAITRFSTPAEQARVAATPCPYGDGHVGTRIAELLDDPAVLEAMIPREPDMTGGMIPSVLEGH